uniref:Uncharacterized protein n=1 Tax=Glossina palpalis gambiensis TaxID=67801 RepID=A0A1B0BEC9_9MUSC
MGSVTDSEVEGEIEPTDRTDGTGTPIMLTTSNVESPAITLYDPFRKMQDTDHRMNKEWCIKCSKIETQDMPPLTALP